MSEETQEEKSLGKRIVILQRGFVYVGDLFEKGLECRLENVKNIRRWGTTKGLGQLSIEGPQQDTILDECGNIEYHKLTSICNMICDETKWTK
ncbi:MAG: hypothetical protein ACW98X_22505 [Promethearchaeota archaeon]